MLSKQDSTPDIKAMAHQQDPLPSIRVIIIHTTARLRQKKNNVFVLDE